MSTAEIFEIIARHALEVLPALQHHHFKQSDSLRELGANSIDRADIIIMTLESLGLSIPLTAMAKAQNMGELANIIHEKS
ncbi:MAG: acyl carrier protein [Steroidobacteraceae bacterium]